MAKQNANARSKRVANKKRAANRQKNEYRNQSRSLKEYREFKSECYSGRDLGGRVSVSDKAALKAMLMPHALDYFRSGKRFDHFGFETNTGHFELGIISYGTNIFNAKYQTLCWGIDENSEIMKMWDECMDDALRQQASTGLLRVNYVIADSREEAWGIIREELMDMVA